MSVWNELNEIGNQEENLYLDNIENGMALISDLLSISEAVPPSVQAFQEIENEFEEWKEKKRTWSIHDGDDFHQNFNVLLKSMGEYALFPELMEKHIIAIGGSFSAGKSRIINSIIQEQLLPMDTTPTTSIPTYILNGENSIAVLNRFNHWTSIDLDALKAISHSFYEHYNLRLSSLLSHIQIKSEKMIFKNIAFMDTPGYTKAETIVKDSDVEIAQKNLSKADYIIWVVDVEKGVIPEQDLNFLQSLEFTRPIFFVFNKADKKSRNDLRDIRNLAEETLKKTNLNIAGIAMVSAKFKKEYSRQRLSAFLKKVNEKRRVKRFLSKVKKLLTSYEQEFIQRMSKLKNELKKINMVAVYSTFDDENKQIQLVELLQEKKKNIKTLKDEYETFEEMKNKMFVLVKQFEATLEKETKTEKVSSKSYIKRKKTFWLSNWRNVLNETSLNRTIESFIRDDLIATIEECFTSEKQLVTASNRRIANSLEIYNDANNDDLQRCESETLYDESERLLNSLCERIVGKSNELIDEKMNTIKGNGISKEELSFHQEIIEEIKLVLEERLIFPYLSARHIDIVNAKEFFTKDDEPFLSLIFQLEFENYGKQITAEMKKELEDVINLLIHELEQESE
ncbi:MAG: dynamin family protein [Bacillaceae bacterium]|nr:dynamin family protein [Bacillaceae bacterium]